MTEPPALRHRSSRRFDEVLVSRGLRGRVVELPESTRTAAEAARGVGCELRQIVKSLVFRGTSSGSPVLILASGANRVDEGWMARYVGEPLGRADPEYVRSLAGYAIGGVPPTGHASPIPTFIDYDLLELPEVWAAAGHPHAVCRLTSRELLDITRGHAVPITPIHPPDSGTGAWVTFDCYGTLVDWRAGLLRPFEQRHGALSTGERDRLFRAYEREERALESGRYRPYREVMAEALVHAGQAEGYELSASEAAQGPEAIPEWSPFADTREALNDLRGHGFRIGVLSNIDTDLLERTLDRFGFQPDLVVTAEEVGSYKPAPPHWIRFLKRTGTSPDRVLHVSGSYEYDVAPAQALGFRTAFIERYGGPPPGQEVGLALPGLAGLAGHLGQRPGTDEDVSTGR